MSNENKQPDHTERALELVAQPDHIPDAAKMVSPNQFAGIRNMVAQSDERAALTEEEKLNILDWVSACQSAYHIDSTPGHRFGGLGSNLEENRGALIECVESVIASRATQQATKGDERAAFTMDSHERNALNEAVKQLPSVSALRTLRDRLLATTPSPVAGSAGQAPVAWRAPNLSGCGDAWAYRDADDRFEDARGQLVGEPLYAAPSLMPERKTSNPHKGGTEAYLATEHFNEGWNACLDAWAPSLTTDAGAVTDEQRDAIQWALDAAACFSGPRIDRVLPVLSAMLAAHPTNQRPDPSDIQGWAVTVNVNTVDILTIGHNSLSGIDNIGDFAEVVRNCAKHLTAFIGDDGTAQRMSDAARDAEDAARYRWLKANTRTYSLDMGGNHRYDPSRAFMKLRGPSLDDAFDAARKAEIESGGGSRAN